VVLDADGRQQEDDEGERDPRRRLRRGPVRDEKDEREHAAVKKEVEQLVGRHVPAVDVVERPHRQLVRRHPVLVVLGEEPARAEPAGELVGVEDLPLVRDRQVNHVPPHLKEVEGVEADAEREQEFRGARPTHKQRGPRRPPAGPDVRPRARGP
jgi:hypothetical protein